MSQAAAQQNTAPRKRDSHTDLPVGEILRRTRVHYGQSLEDVEIILRIRAAQLQALEEGRIDLLPGRVYAIGFVRSYAEYLGLDGEKMVNLFKTQSGGGPAPRPRPERHFPVPASESKSPGSFILVSCIAGIIMVVAAFVTMTNKQAPVEPASVPSVPQDLRAEQLAQQQPARLAVAAPPVMGPLHPAAPVPQAVPGVPAIGAAVPETAQAAPQQAATLTESASPDGQAPAAATAPISPDNAAAQAGHELVIRITETSWVEVRGADGRPLLSRVLKPGDSYTVPPGEGLVLDTGNVGGLEFVLDGTTLPPLGAKGDVRRRISLDPAKLTSSASGAAAATLDPAAGGVRE